MLLRAGPPGRGRRKEVRGTFGVSPTNPFSGINPFSGTSPIWNAATLSNISARRCSRWRLHARRHAINISPFIEPCFYRRGSQRPGDGKVTGTITLWRPAMDANHLPHHQRIERHRWVVMKLKPLRPLPQPSVLGLQWYRRFATCHGLAADRRRS